MSHTIAPLTVISRKTAGGIIIEAAGELDLTTVKTLQEPLDECVQATITETEAAPLSVDLRQVYFIDSAGLALLVAARKRLAPAKRTLRVLVTQGQQPERVLKIGRYDTIMALTYDNGE